MGRSSLLELFIEEGNIFVLSAVRAGKEWYISERPGGSSKDYIARVLPNAKDKTFTCVRGRESTKSSPAELMLLRHANEQLSETLPELNSMRVCLPRAPPAGERELEVLDAPCGVLAATLDRRLTSAPSRAAGEPYAVLESRLPKWNARTETYELPFHGRANLASARNFQLVERGAGKADRAVLLYGKLEEDEFALDFAYPLSLLHALAIVLTTWDW